MTRPDSGRFVKRLPVAEISIAAGKGIEVPLRQLREFIREVGLEATDAVAPRTA